MIKKKILVSAPSRFATNIRMRDALFSKLKQGTKKLIFAILGNIELNANKSDTAAENENRSIDLEITEFSQIDSDVVLSKPCVNEIDIPLTSVNSTLQDYNDDIIADSNSVGQRYDIGEIINLEDAHDVVSMPQCPNVDGNPILIID